MYPDITCPDSEITLVSKWNVNNTGHQNVAGKTAIDIWKKMPWPDGLISHSLYLGHNDVTVFQYLQWESKQAIDAFTRNNLEEREENSQLIVQGLECVVAVKYQLYMSMISEKSTGSHRVESSWSHFRSIINGRIHL